MKHHSQAADQALLKIIDEEVIIGDEGVHLVTRVETRSL